MFGRRIDPTDPSHSEHALARNLPRLRALAFFQVFMLIISVAVPLFSERGLDLAQILALQAVFGLVVVVGEVPSGYFADLLGRRIALLVGAVFLGIGHTVLLFAYDFASLVVFEACLGVALSLISGADVALYYDTQMALGTDAESRQKGLGGLFFLRSVSEATAALAASALLLVGTLSDLVLVQAVIGWLPLLFAVGLVEPPVERLDEGGHGANFTRVLRHILGGEEVLRLTFLAMSIWSLTTFYAFWLLQELWGRQGVALSAYGVLFAVFSVISGLAGRHAASFERRFGPTAVLVVAGLAPAVGYFGLAMAPAAVGVLFAALFFVARGAGFVVLQEAFNSRLEGRFRATANSLVSFVFRASFALTFPLVGELLELWTLPMLFYWLGTATLLIFGVLMLPLIGAVRGLPAAAALAEATGVDAEAPAQLDAGAAGEGGERGEAGTQPR